MENALSIDKVIEDLLDKAVRLNKAAQLMIEEMEREVALIKRASDVSRLKELHSTILKDKEIALTPEMLLKNSDADSVSSIPEDKGMYAILSQFLLVPPIKNTPFGTVLVCIGVHGIPDDVTVVNISKQARESKLSEEAVISSLQDEGKELLEGKIFSSLVKILMKRTATGESTLPISAKMFVGLPT